MGVTVCDAVSCQWLKSLGQRHLAEIGAEINMLTSCCRLVVPQDKTQSQWNVYSVTLLTECIVTAQLGLFFRLLWTSCCSAASCDIPSPGFKQRLCSSSKGLSCRIVLRWFMLSMMMEDTNTVWTSLSDRHVFLLASCDKLPPTVCLSQLNNASHLQTMDQHTPPALPAHFFLPSSHTCTLKPFVFQGCVNFPRVWGSQKSPRWVLYCV